MTGKWRDIRAEDAEYRLWVGTGRIPDTWHPPVDSEST